MSARGGGLWPESRPVSRLNLHHPNMIRTLTFSRLDLGHQFLCGHDTICVTWLVKDCKVGYVMILFYDLPTLFNFIVNL